MWGPRAPGNDCPVIEVTRLTKRYGSTTAVDELTFTALPGVITGFIGPNGAGKSTTMRLVLGLDRPDAGHARVNGERYASYGRPLHQLGALLEAQSTHPGRTAYRHLLWLAQTHGIKRSRIDEVLALAGLGSVAHKRVGTFSLGMGQRLGVAAALLGEPRAVMLDEPMNGLDPEGMVWIRDLLRTLADEDRTVLVSSHLMGEMEKLADKLIVIGRGRLLAEATPAELRSGHGSLEDAFLELTRADVDYHGSTR